MRRLPALLVLAATTFGPALACGGGGGGEKPTEPGEPASQVTTVEVTPASATLDALDATRDFDATARDQSGDAVSGVSFTWSISPESVGSVDGDGTVTAESNGTATVEASARGVAGSARLTVDQELARVTVEPGRDSLEVPDSRHFDAAARDPNGQPLAEQPSFDWSSSTPEVASVDDAGRVTAREAGRAEIRAAADGVRGSAELRVLAEGTPTIDSITPRPIEEGTTATIVGDDFGSSPAGLEVVVDGKQARIVSTSPTRARIEVPSYSCRPSRAVAVRATRDGKTSPPESVALKPDEPTVRPAVGEQTVLPTSSGGCVQFPSDASGEQYLIGVQSTAEDATVLDTVSIESSAAADRSRAGLMAAGRSGDPGPAPEAGRIGSRAASRLVRPTRRSARREVAAYDSPPPAGLPPGTAVAAAVGPEVSEGDTVTLNWVTERRRSAGCRDEFVTVDAVVRAIGTHGIFVTDVENPAPGLSDDNLESLLRLFDETIYPVETDWFGAPTDLDENDRVVVLFSKEGNRRGGSHVMREDYVTDESCEISNGGEIIYTFTADSAGTFGPSFSRSDAVRALRFTLAHEFTHVMQAARRAQTSDPGTSSWMIEGQAHVAEEVVGHEVLGRRSGQDYGSDVAGSEDFAGVSWYEGRFERLSRYFGHGDGGTVEAAPGACSWLWGATGQSVGSALGPCDGPIGAARGTAWAFLRWVTDQYGDRHPGGAQGLHREILDLIGSGRTSFEKLEEVTGVPADSLLARWAAALYADGRVAGLADELRFPSWELNDVMANHGRLDPPQRRLSDLSLTRRLRGGSTAYLLVENAREGAASVEIAADPSGGLPDHLQLWVLRTQ